MVAVKQFFFLYVPSVVVIFMLSVGSARCFPGAEHASDMAQAIMGGGGAELNRLLQEFSKTVDNFEVVRGVPVGNAGHRVYGHWGFSDSIPFDRGELKGVLDRIEASGGEAAREAAKERIRIAWRHDVNKLVDITRRLSGLDGRAAHGLAGLLYDIHLLGDWQGVKVSSLQGVEHILVDIEKNINRMFGNHSRASRDAIRALKSGVSLAQKVCGQSSPCVAAYVLKSLKEGEVLRPHLASLLSRKSSVNSFFINPKGVELVRLPNSLQAYRQAAEKSGAKVASVLPGVLLPDGRLLVALKTGASSGGIAFAVDAAGASYQYLKGDILKHEYQRELVCAALNGSAVGGGTAVAVLLGATPAGLVVVGVGVGAYLAMDTVQRKWLERRDRALLSLEDLKMVGIPADSPLDLEVAHGIPLNVENW